MTLYAGGLRLSEAADLQIAHIDSGRMQLNVAAGKGNKQRLVPLSPRLLTALRTYWPTYPQMPANSALLTSPRIKRRAFAQAIQDAAAR